MISYPGLTRYFALSGLEKSRDLSQNGTSPHFGDGRPFGASVYGLIKDGNKLQRSDHILLRVNHE